jgi:hypothetical protein
MEIIDDESFDNYSTSQLTIESSSTANPKYNYCLNYIKTQNYANRKTNLNQAAQLIDPIDLLNEHIEPSQLAHVSKQGLTPPSIVLSTIRNRLYKANQAIETKKFDLLSNFKL